MERSLCDVCVDTGDVSDCSFQPTRELSSEGNDNSKLGIITGIYAIIHSNPLSFSCLK